MAADALTYRGVAMMVARLVDAQNWPLLLSASVQSITQDYSWAPGLVPGFLLEHPAFGFTHSRRS